MRIEPFDDGTRLMARAAKKTQQPAEPITEAQRVRAMPNPYLAAVARQIRRELIGSKDHLHDKKIFHFEDGSFLTFEVSYMAVEDGGRS
jgi:hypothetical protein